VNDLQALRAVQLDVRMMISDIAAADGMSLPSAELPIAGLEVSSAEHQVPHTPLGLDCWSIQTSGADLCCGARTSGWALGIAAGRGGRPVHLAALWFYAGAHELLRVTGV
jgi:hypothetical protein